MNIEALDGVSETRSFIVNHLILYSGSDVALRTTRLQDKHGNRREWVCERDMYTQNFSFVEFDEIILRAQPLNHIYLTSYTRAFQR